MDLDRWDLSVINNVIKYKDIEREIFDIKGPQLSELDKDICAMANSIHGGVLLLGIDQIGRDQYIERFEKNGFFNGKEDFINREIGNYHYKVDLLPKVATTIVYEVGSPKFYVVVRVEGRTNDIPYVNRGTCYILVGNSSRPASRDTIISLCRNTIDRTSSVEVLHVTASLLKQQLTRIAEQVDKEARHVLKTGFLPETDNETFKDSAMRCMWFIRENDLLLARTDPKLNRKQGLFTVIYNLQELNNAIWRFNNEELNAGNRLPNFLDFYNVWKAENDGDIHSYFDRLISAAGTFLLL